MTSSRVADTSLGVATPTLLGGPASPGFSVGQESAVGDPTELPAAARAGCEDVPAPRSLLGPAVLPAPGLALRP